ncbi:MAG: hypothetical protein K2X39_09035, partial [Silvanigrellaceae bacterium]|nr:hypothetical protein [Silvanigrellaceae bacterium]
RIMNYNDEEILQNYAKQLLPRLESKAITKEEYETIMATVKNYFYEYPYLITKSRLEIVD